MSRLMLRRVHVVTGRPSRSLGWMTGWRLWKRSLLLDRLSIIIKDESLKRVVIISLMY
jgi:hypothetical protein